LRHTDEEIAEALVHLAVNHYRFDKASEETGVPETTLRRWAKQTPKRGVADLLDRAVARMLMCIPKNWEGKDWGITVGILLDKWLLAQGRPTVRTESIVSGLDALSEKERQEVIENARRILEGLSRPSGGSGDSGGNGRIPAGELPQRTREIHQPSPEGKSLEPTERSSPIGQGQS
jgi:hypothetical protein